MTPSQVYYVGDFSFPEGGANALRVLGNARSIQSAGFDVRIICTGSSESSNGNGWSSWNGFEFHNACVERTATGWPSRLYNYATRGVAVARILRSCLGENVAAVVCTAGGQLRFFPILDQLCRSRHVPLICDVMDWYEPSHLLMGRGGVFHAEHEYCMRRLFPRIGNIIAISTFLENHFLSRGCRVLRVPPLVAFDDPKWSSNNAFETSNQIRLAFVGTAGKKDLICNAIKGLKLLGSDALQFSLMIVGPTHEEIRRNLGADGRYLDELSQSITVLGRIDHRSALSYIGQSHFTILLRPELRFARAGFPTKLVESLAMGVPVIGNPVGDVGQYLADTIEGIILPDASPHSFASGLRRTLALSRNELAQMRLSCKKRAVASFDCLGWSGPFKRFLENVAVSR